MMDRRPITAVNRQRLLADSLRACTTEEIVSGVADELRHRYASEAPLVALDIADAADDGERDVSGYSTKGYALLVFTCVGLILLGLAGVYAVRSMERDIEAYQGEFRHG